MFNKTDDPNATGASPADTVAAKPAVRPVASAAAAKAESSLISPGLKVLGNLECDGDVVIAGTVEGDISGKSLTVREGARVTGSIRVDTLHIMGSVKGKVAARSVRIAASGEMTGDVQYEILAIEEGAMLDGQCRRGKAGGSTVSKLKTVEGGAGKSDSVAASAVKGSGQKAS